MNQFTTYINIVGKTVQKYNGIKKYISTGAVNDNTINEKKVEYVSYNDKPSRANLSVKNGDILFAKMENTEKTLIIDDENKDYIYSTGFFAVRPIENIITHKCLYYLLQSEQFLKEKDKYCSGATQKAITNEGLKKILVNVPDILTQADLVKKLDKIEEVILLRKRQLEKLNELIKSRFVEMFGDPVYNDYKWLTQPLNIVCTNIVDCPHSTPNYTTKNTGYMCIRTSIVKKNQIMWDKIEYITEQEYYQRIKRKQPVKGDVVYTREGAILGIAATIDRDCKVALGQRLMLLSPDTTKCLPQFLSIVMNFDSFLKKVLVGVSGSASPHINVADIKSFAIIIPPIELQEQFAEFVEKVDKSKFESKLHIKIIRKIERRVAYDKF